MSTHTNPVPKSKKINGGEFHCALNNPSLKHPIEFDWLDEVFKKI